MFVYISNDMIPKYHVKKKQINNNKKYVKQYLLKSPVFWPNGNSNQQFSGVLKIANICHFPLRKVEDNRIPLGLSFEKQMAFGTLQLHGAISLSTFF